MPYISPFNYTSTKKLVPYVVGSYTIVDSRQLQTTDLFTSGLAALTQATDFPQVLMEHVYTADSRNVPALMAMLKTGLDVKLARTRDLAAVIHIQRLENGSLQFTAVPLLYGSYALKQGAGTFSPSTAAAGGINLVAGLADHPLRPGAPDQSLLQDFAAQSPAGKHTRLQCARSAERDARRFRDARPRRSRADQRHPGS